MSGQPIIKPIDNICSASLIQVAVPAILLIFSIELFWFAKAQDIWIDETTQLSGITLKLPDMLNWLTGQELGRFGVPGDRMPPISYLLDWSWLWLVGPSEVGFRLFHAAFVVGGAFVLATVVRREMGTAATIVVLLFLMLSPKLIQTGVEIRAYPIFFAITCVQVAVFLRLVPKSPRDIPDAPSVNFKLLILFAGLCLLAIYSHFYGVVSTCAFFLALGSASMRSWRSLTILMIVFVCVVAAASGLVPFLTSAFNQSSLAMIQERSSPHYLAYLLRLFGDSANMLLFPAAILFFGGASTLLVSGTVAALVRMARQQATSIDWLILVVGVGAAIPILASLVIARFNVMSPNYSGWILAPLTLVVGAGAASPLGFRVWDKGGRFVAIGATLLGAAISTFFFLTHAQMFIHGPQRFVSAVFDRIGSPKAIVYEGTGWGYSYFPLLFTHGGEIDQYRAADGRVQATGADRIGFDRTVHQNIVSAISSYSHLLLVDTELRTYRDLRACQGFEETCPRFMRSKIEEELIATGQWRESTVRRSFGLYDTQVKTVERIPEICRTSVCR
jgi:hypothetical protein